MKQNHVQVSLLSAHIFIEIGNVIQKIDELTKATTIISNMMVELRRSDQILSVEVRPMTVIENSWNEMDHNHLASAHLFITITEMSE